MKTTKELTAERGKNYGHPAKHFMCTQDLFSSWDERRADALDGQCDNYDLEYPLRHIVYMICDKLARAAENPLHMDNFEDIQGYASLWKMCVDEESQ